MDDDLCYEPYAPVAVELAQAILDGRMSIVEGCHQLWKPLHELFSDDDAAFDAIMEVIGFTADLPRSADRHLWNPQVVAEKDAVLDAWLPIVTKRVQTACHEIVRRFTPPGDRTCD